MAEIKTVFSEKEIKPKITDNQINEYPSKIKENLDISLKKVSSILQTKNLVEIDSLPNNKSFFVSIVPKSKDSLCLKKNLSSNKIGYLSRNGNTLEYSEEIEKSTGLNKKEDCSIGNMSSIFNYNKFNKLNNLKFSLIYESLEEDVRQKLKNDKNLSFCCIGESLKDNFFLGATNYFTHDSFFIKVLNLTIKLLKEDEKFDIILIDFIKFHKEKFLLDYVSHTIFILI